MRIRCITKNSTSRKNPKNRKYTTKNRTKNENQKKKNPTSRRIPMNLWEINKNWRATGKPRKDKERKFQENAKEHEADKEKQWSE